jgi:hypothetical protein
MRILFAGPGGIGPAGCAVVPGRDSAIGVDSIGIAGCAIRRGKLENPGVM